MRATLIYVSFMYFERENCKEVVQENLLDFFYNLLNCSVFA